MPINAAILRTTPGAGLEALKNAVASTLGDPDTSEIGTFKAVVISELMPLTYAQLYGDVPPGKGDTVAVYYFWGRILDGDTGHMMLPDNCDPAFAMDDQLNFEVTTWHTRFIMVAEGGKTDQSGDKPKYGDFVEVGLRSTKYGYDTSMGTFLKKVSDGFGTDPSQKTCVRIGADAFTSGEAVQMGSFIGLPAPEGISYKNSSVVVLTSQKNFLEDLRKEVDSRQAGIGIMVNSGLRTPEQQAKAMLDIWNDKGAAYLNKLYGNGSLIKSVTSDAANKNLATFTATVQNLANSGQHFSTHQSANGLDLRSKEWTDAQADVVLASAQALGATVLREPTDCWGNQPPYKRQCNNEHYHLKIPANYSTAPVQGADPVVGE